MYSLARPGLLGTPESSALSEVPLLASSRPGQAGGVPPHKGVRISRVARETGKPTGPQRPGVTPGRPAPETFLVSRANRKNPQPFLGCPHVQPGLACRGPQNPQPFLGCPSWPPLGLARQERGHPTKG